MFNLKSISALLKLVVLLPFEIIWPGFTAGRKSKARMTICKSCPHGLYLSATRQCNPVGGCGCFLPAKTRIPVAKCPKGEW